MAATMRMKGFDGLAISLSGLCLIHCLALPLIAVSLPVAGILADAEWLHWAFVAFAAPVSLMALARPSRQGLPLGLVFLAMVGIGALVIGAVGWPSESYETPITVLGGLVLASVHILNWRRGRHGHGEA